MDKNKRFIGLILAIVLGIIIVGGGAYYLGKNSSKQEVNDTSLSKFLYTNGEPIPHSFIMEFAKVKDFSTGSISNESICKSNGEKVQNVVFVDKANTANCPIGISGCGNSFRREAVICGDKYIIEDAMGSSGFNFYGPFDLKK